MFPTKKFSIDLALKPDIFFTSKTGLYIELHGTFTRIFRPYREREK